MISGSIDSEQSVGFIDSVGYAVGVALGLVVGDSLGLVVGESVGEDDGDVVGELEGSADLVGASDGAEEG